jgi:GT2 family glycosyltransferase
MPTFDIILTVWNRLEYTKRTVASLIESGAYDACQRFIVVDNHSLELDMDSFLNDLMHYQKVFILRRPQNDGWGAAVNDAIGLSRAEYVFLSNNDVEYTSEFYKRMFESFEHHPMIGILGVWRHTGHGFTKDGINDEWFRDMDNVPAVGWMLPKKAMEAVGMLPEHGPCPKRGGNGEDTEYVGRMKENGFLVGVLKEDIANHFDGY